ncbi:MAG TPA: GNAT family N-acetyltransferase [Candidatus Limnocylindrales bacterium]|nr:GNAT family N-acetyltransferase [Candidatus Limnocylindrales bacterium]
MTEPASAADGIPGVRTRPLARIRATVDAERAADELGLVPEGLPDDPHLGAAVSLVRAPGESPIALVEPITEGRLAATLARHGEGEVGAYLEAVDGLVAARSAAVRAGVRVSRPASGPFGPSFLVLGGPAAGPHTILAEPASGYHRPMIERRNVTLRQAAEADAERIATLFTDEGYPAGPSDVVERLGRFASPHSQVIVADYEGEVLGFIAIHALPRFEHSDRVVRVMALVVDAGVRDRGVGHLLMEEAERIGRELGAAYVEVTAGHHRADARHLYESLGYDASVASYLRKRL